MPDDSLPAIPETDVEEMVFDGEVVDETAAGARPGALAVPGRVLVLSPVTRHAMYVAAGVVVAVRRWHLKRTRHERMQRALEIQGNHEAMLAWRVQREIERHQRAERRVELVRAFAELVKVSPVIGAILLILMILTGVAMAVVHRHPADIFWPWMTLFRAIVLAVSIASVAWLVLSAVAVVTLLAWLHYLGRTGEMTPRWAVTSAAVDMDVSIDEVTVTQALKNMRIPQVKDYLDQNLPLQFLVPCRQDGRGTYAEIRLPGVPAEKIIRRRADFAAGLYRLPKEVWPSIGSEAAILKVWIADKGALEEGAGPYPLLLDGLCDVFKGVPFGRTLRGDPVVAPLMERNTLTGGMPGQGKSAAARVMMCGAALDPSAELWILIPDTNFDFEVMKRRCTRYVMGAEDEKIELIRDWLLDLRDEVQRRGQLLVDYEVPAVTRRLASANVGLHPLFVLLEEAHIAITHKVYGKEISGLLVDIVKLGRKRGIHMIVSTQAPTKDSMPRDVTRNCSNGIAFAVGDHVANDALLGQGAYAGGHRATELIPGTDRGTALVKGFSGQRSEMVQVYFLDVARGHDQVTPIIARAMAELGGRGLPGSIGPVLAIETHDLLTDLDAVLGDERVKLRDVIGLLRNLAPSWPRYKAMTIMQLRDDLADEGVKDVNTSGTFWLDPAAVREVLAAREASE